MRVSIVATALDGQQPSNVGVVNMVNRIQNRNTGYSDGLFSKNTFIPSNSYGASISGATALKLDEQFEVGKEQEESLNTNNQIEDSLSASHENRSKIENSLLNNDIAITQDELVINTVDYNNSEDETVHQENTENLEADNYSNEQTEEEYTPKLFSEEDQSLDRSENDEKEHKLLDLENNQEEDFEIPAFLRRQKF